MNRGNRLGAQVGLLLCALISLVPILLIVLSSFKPDAEILKFQGVLPARPTLENYRQVVGTPEEFPIGRWFLNSVFVSSASTLLVLVVDSLAAYGLARLALPGARWVFAAIVGTMMIPGQVLLVPVYQLLNRLGWIDTPLALIVPAGAGAFGVFMLYQFFQTVPREIEEAARLDGCGHFRTFAQVVLPLVRPALATLGIFTFVGSWNDFLGPWIMLMSEQGKWPLAVVMYKLQWALTNWQPSQGSMDPAMQQLLSSGVGFNALMALAVVESIPMFVAFLIFREQLMKGIQISGLKG